MAADPLPPLPPQAAGHAAQPDWVDFDLPKLRQLWCDREEASARGDEAAVDSIRGRIADLEEQIASRPYAGQRGLSALAEVVGNSFDSASMVPCDDPLIVAVIRNLLHHAQESGEGSEGLSQAVVPGSILEQMLNSEDRAA
ncbi:hypothetical protein [Geminicoccus harenae]|nr:hypothetical protein [Geminicoccus harenae]